MVAIPIESALGERFSDGKSEDSIKPIITGLPVEKNNLQSLPGKVFLAPPYRFFSFQVLTACKKQKKEKKPN